MPLLLSWQSTTQAFIEPLGNGETLTMVRIPAGSFQMGSPEQESGRDEDEGPVHRVELQEFLMASTPITQAQWREVAGWSPPLGETWPQILHLEPSIFQAGHTRHGEGESETQELPVERITWEEAMEFCRRLSRRTGRHYTLPSEAQWEYACRAGGTGVYGFGATLTAELATLRWPTAVVDGPRALEDQQTSPVRLHPANAWGLHDMHGNLWEWCLDHWHSSYRGAPQDGSAWINHGAPSSADRVVRGGAWSDPASDARSACRYRLPPQSREPAIVGLRVVCVPGGAEIESKPLVVWIDDHHDNNRSERSALEAEGMRVVLADSDNDVLGLLASESVDLLISDMSRHQDPEAGLKLLKRLRAAPERPPVMFYVGAQNANLAEQAKLMGANAVVTSPTDLLAAVRAALAPQKAGLNRLRQVKGKLL